MTPARKPLSYWSLFGLFFGSVGLLLFGLGTLVLMFWPALAGQFGEAEVYYGELPLAAEREEAFVDIATLPPRQLYPPLRTSIDDVAEGNWIRIPSIDVAVPLVMSDSMEDKDVLATLSEGAALYPNGVLPGHLGNTFISAHSTGQPWKGKYRFAFLRINELEAGSIVHLDYQGIRYTYRITSQDIIVPDPSFRVASGRPRPTLTFMACWPLWSTSKRMLTHAELTNVTQLRSPSFAGQAQLEVTSG